MKRIKYMVALLACAGIANASIITITNITYTGTAPELLGNGLDDENNIINGNGLSASLTDANIETVTHANVNFSDNAWVTTDPGGYPSDFFASTTDTVIFKFDLGGSTTVGTFASWGYTFGSYNGNAISNVTLDFSTDGGLTTDSSQTIAVPLGVTPNASTVIPLTPTTANFITMTINDNHYGNAKGGDRVGLAEVAFSTEVIPEPATFGLLAAFGGAVLFIRRRR